MTTLTVLLFALPLAIAVGQLYRSQEVAELQRDATRVVALVPDSPIDSARRLHVPRAAERGEVIGLYNPRGRRAGGVGPNHSRLSRGAADGRVHVGSEAGQLAVVVPVPSDRQVVAVVRAAVPSGLVTGRTARSWAAMALLGLLVISVAALLARRQAGRIAAPLERLTVAAQALGNGNFAVRTQRSGITEADAAGVALRDTAGRLGHLLQRERQFSADASHQLRTPLTGLLVGLESALNRPDADLRRALRDAVDRGQRLQLTVEDLLALHRDADTAPGTLDIEVQLSAARAAWRPQFASRGRSLLVTVEEGLPLVTASAPALRQILDVLLENALAHGAGTVSVTAANVGEVVAVEVADQGDGLRGDPEAAFSRRASNARGHGIGLALARSLAEADGGRLVIRRPCPAPVFALLLPVADTVVVAAPPEQSAAGQASSS